MSKYRYIKLIILLFNLIILTRIIFLMCDISYREDYYNYFNKIYELGDAPRGRILDRNGNVLVDNKGVKVLVYNKMDNNGVSEFDIASKLSKYISFDDELSDKDLRSYYYLKYKNVIDKRIDEEIIIKYKSKEIDINEYTNYKYSLIKKSEIEELNHNEVIIYKLLNKGYYYEDKVILDNISEELLVNINKLNIPGIRFDMKYVRVYLYDTVLNQLFGDVGLIPLEYEDYYKGLGYDLDDRVGISYLEKKYDKYLKGTKSKYKIKNNKLYKISDSVKGKDLVLGIDINIQLKIENILKKQILSAKKYKSSKYYNGSYIVLSNSDTGELISLVGINYDGYLFNSDVIGLFNKSFTVGSVVKGASQYVALDKGKISKRDVLDGCVKLKNQGEKCSHKSLGYLNDINALAYSSNYYQFINLFNVLDIKYKRNMSFNPSDNDFVMYRNYFKLFGLGDYTGIDIEEVTGIKGSKISGDLLLNYVIGQYDTYTPIQLNQYVSTVSNGIRKKLRIADYIIDNNSVKYSINSYKEFNRLNNNLLSRVRDGFNASIKYGTGVNYFDAKLGGGKTGTSETFYNGISTTTKSFVGYYNINGVNYAISIVSPNISYKNNGINYTYPINSRLSRQIVNILFEN